MNILKLTILATSLSFFQPALASDQKDLKPVVNAKAKILKFDWPALKIGTAEYKEGPTGVTVFHFPERAYVAMDARGGGTGTINGHYMDIGYDMKELDTIVFSGGSWYGLESVTAVATALKDDKIRDGAAFGAKPNIAMSVGSIIFDFGGRRLNEIYPDKKLAQAAFRGAKTGEFPMGATGAGRFAMSGGFFGCNAHSGQGGAFRQIGNVKIAAFVIANPFGVISDREGNVVSCHKGKNWPAKIKVTDLMKNFPESADPNWQKSSSKNTTVSLIVTNQKLTPVELKRMAVQVHTSMGRGIQPFTTIVDGDVIYAVSTAEVDEPNIHALDIGVIASEVMWDALINTVPEADKTPFIQNEKRLSKRALKKLAGSYEFSSIAALEINVKNGKIYGKAVGRDKVYSIGHKDEVELKQLSKTDFIVESRYPLVLRFNKKNQVTLNPGHWEQIGRR